MNEELAQSAVVDLLAPLLGDGKSAKLLVEDTQELKPTDSKYRRAVRRLIGSTPRAVGFFLDGLVGRKGTHGTLIRTGHAGDETYRVG